MASLKGNVILNGINTATSLLFPIITFPYAARVLLPEGIGIINFLNSIIHYIVLLTSLGIPMYAVKEIAKFRNDLLTRNKTTIEIIILSTILCAIGYVIVWILGKYVPEINSQLSIFYILSLTIIFTSIGVNWFYQAIEDFKFITIRAVIIRTISAACLFIFVHNASDLLIYAIILVGSTVGNNIINFIHLRKYVTLKTLNIRNLKIWRHIYPAFQVFIMNVIISLYIQLNSVMLGFISGDDAVGYFTGGTRISHIGLTLISSLSTVLLPRCSHLIQEGDIVGFRKVISKSLGYVQLMSYPMSIGLMVLSVPITLIFCGNEYYNSIPVLILNAPVIIFISLTNIMGIQILYPLDKIKLVIISVAGGAILNLVLNFILIPKYQAVGASIATLIAEFGVLLLQAFLGRKYYPFKIGKLINIKYLCISLLMGIIVYFSTFFLPHNWIKILIGLPVGVIFYIGMLYIVRDKYFNEMVKYAASFIHKF